MSPFSVGMGLPSMDRQRSLVESSAFATITKGSHGGPCARAQVMKVAPVHEARCQGCWLPLMGEYHGEGAGYPGS